MVRRGRFCEKKLRFSVKYFLWRPGQSYVTIMSAHLGGGETGGDPRPCIGTRRIGRDGRNATKRKEHPNMRQAVTAFLSACLLFALCACSPQGTSAGASSGQPQGQTSAPEQESGAYAFADSLGNTVALEGAPRRVAALMGSFAESWLLAGGELIGVTQDAYDERGLALPEGTANLGSIHTPDLEGLFAADPDFVILSSEIDGQRELADSLSAAGIPAAWFRVETFEDYLHMLEIFTGITGRADLYRQNGLDVQARIDAAVASVPEGAHPTVLLLRAYSSGVKAKNSDNMAGAMLADLGAVNIADQNSGLLEDLQMEAIMAADPDFILAVTMGSDTQKALDSLSQLMEGDPAWQSLSAVGEGRYLILDKALFHYKPNTRWGESYEALADILYGEDR